VDDAGIVDDFAARPTPGSRLGFHHAVKLLDPRLYSSQLLGSEAHRFQTKAKFP
jgi:hypothetical protein